MVLHIELFKCNEKILSSDQWLKRKDQQSVHVNTQHYIIHVHPFHFIGVCVVGDSL